MTLTTEEVAAFMGVTPNAVRKLVFAGHLTPLRRNTRPLRFWPEEVWAYTRRRGDRERMLRLAERWESDDV